jgi:hypothetical protein
MKSRPRDMQGGFCSLYTGLRSAMAARLIGSRSVMAATRHSQYRRGIV